MFSARRAATTEVNDSQFELLGVVPGDVEGAVRQVALRMSNAAREDPKFAEMLTELAASRGGIYARALRDLESRERAEAAVS
jgi:hypothetical protein